MTLLLKKLMKDQMNIKNSYKCYSFFLGLYILRKFCYNDLARSKDGG